MKSPADSWDVQIEEAAPLVRKIKVTLPAEVMEGWYSRVTADYCRQAVLPGFRKGKAPPKLVEQQFGGRIYQDVIDRAINESCREVLTQKEIRPFSQPRIESLDETYSRGKTFTYTASVELPPRVELQTYTGLKIEAPRRKVEDKQVEDQIRSLQERTSTLVPVENRTKVEKGDFVVMDFQATDEAGAPIPAFNGNDHTHMIGSGFPIPGFDDGMIGAAKGETRELNLAAPDDFPMDMIKGKKTKFMVNVKEIKSRVLPELTDDWAKDLGDFSTLEALRTQIRNDLTTQSEQEFQDNVRMALRAELVKKNKLDVPQTMVHEQMEQLAMNMVQRFQQQRVSEAKITEILKENAAKLQTMAEEQVKAALLVHEVARKEGISVTDDELDERLKSLKKNADETLSSIRERGRREGWLDGLRQEFLDRKVFEFLTKQASIKETVAKD